MPRTPLVLLLSLAAAARAQGPTDPAPDTRPPAAAPEGLHPEASPPASAPGVTLSRGAVLEEVTGVVRGVDRKAHEVRVDANGIEVKLSLDRNTMVYTGAGLGTVLDLVPGAQIKAGRNAESLAYWVQVRPPAAKGGPAAPPSTPGQGTGPAGGAAAGATEAGAAEAGTAPGAGPTPGGAGPAPAGGTAPSGAPGP
jgi:hypothetical protein